MADGDAGTAPRAEVIRLHTIRTLVLARDLSFRRRAMTVLADLGVVSFAIAGCHPPDVLAVVERERPDVVVLDATGCGHAITDVVQVLGEHVPRTGVVIVSGSADDRVGLPVLPKWGWATDLSQAVQEAYRQGNPLNEERTLHAR